MSQYINYSVLNLDYNSIQQREQLNKIIIQTKAIIQNKIRHINDLSQLYEKQQGQRQIIINRMEQNTSNNYKLIEDYKNQIFSINQSYQKFIKDSEQQKEKQKKSIEINHHLQITQINKKIEQFQTQYKKLKQFEDLQSNYINKIDEIKKQITSKQYEHHDILNKEQTLQHKENIQLKHKADNDLHQSKKNAPSRAFQNITSEIKSNQIENIQLKEKLLQLQSQLSKLKKQRNQILSKRKELKINVTLNQEQLEQYKAVGSLQKAKIKAYKDKIQNLKVMISQEVSKKQKVVTDAKKQRQAGLKTLKLKLFNLQKEKQQLKIKMQKINLLGQTILQQRSQIQQFFIMALQNCKRQIDEQFKNKQSGNDDNRKSYGNKVDIEQLLPKDKQRILTNLYTKLAFGSK